MPTYLLSITRYHSLQREKIEKQGSRVGLQPSQLITNKKLGDWRGKMLSQLRKVILEADPDSPRNGSGIPRGGRAAGLFAAPVPSRIM
jgi:hypothetical protein